MAWTLREYHNFSSVKHQFVTIQSKCVSPFKWLYYGNHNKKRLTSAQNTMLPMISATYKGEFISLWINHETFCDYFQFFLFFYSMNFFSLISAPVNCRCLNHVIFFILSMYSYDNSIGMRMRMKVVNIMELMLYDGYQWEEMEWGGWQK